MAKYINAPRLLWKIMNFNSVQKSVSPTILIGGVKCQLTFSRFVGMDGTENIRLVLERLSAAEISTASKFKIEVDLLESDGDYYSLGSGNYSLKHSVLHVWSDAATIIPRIVGEVDDITFLVSVMPVSNMENLFNNQESFGEVSSESLCVKNLIGDLENLFNNEENSDFVLKCNERKFHVHKTILSVRSEFFAGLFRSDMKEVNVGVATIGDLEPETLELVLRYLYTSKLPKLRKESLQKVYAAADRLGVESLKVKCQSMFVDNIRNDSEKYDNATEKEPTDANKQNEESQKVKHDQIMKGLFMTKEWRILSEEFPHEAQEMCKHYLLYKQ